MSATREIAGILPGNVNRKIVPYVFICVRCNREALIDLTDWYEYQSSDCPKWVYLVIGIRIFHGCPDCFPQDTGSPGPLLDFAKTCSESVTLW